MNCYSTMEHSEAKLIFLLFFHFSLVSNDSSPLGICRLASRPWNIPGSYFICSGLWNLFDIVELRWEHCLLLSYKTIELPSKFPHVNAEKALLFGTSWIKYISWEQFFFFKRENNKLLYIPWLNSIMNTELL